MKKPITLLVTLFLIILPSIGQWEYHVIDNLDIYTSTITTGDIENDGDIDMAISGYGRNILLLYENNNFTWTKDTVDSYINGVLGVDIADFDKDGNPDIMAAACYGDYIAWYKNDGGDPVNWLKDTIDVFDGALVAWAKDINGDGAVDVYVNSFITGTLLWYENNLPAGWIKHYIGSRIAYGNSTIGDINEDGKPDILGASHNAGGSVDAYKVILYINNLPDTNWTEIIIDEQLSGAFDARFGDIDNDGDIDVAGTDMYASEDETDIAWYENDGTAMAWTKHPVCTDMVSARTLAMADVDNDGYIDVMAGDVSADDIILFRNEDGGQNWTKIIIDDSYKTPNTIWFSDVDLDGDPDLTSSTESAEHLVWYENHAPGTAFPVSLELSSFLMQPEDDSLTVISRVSNPDSHPVCVFAIVTGDQSKYQDTLFLFNDGLHEDGDPLDSLWGNSKKVTGVPEDSYIVDLISYDSTFNTSFTYHPSRRFITFGPLVSEGFEFYSQTDTLFNPGDYISINPVIRNNSATAYATNISVKLVSLDEYILISDYAYSLESIPAGESATPSFSYSVRISEECPPGSELPVGVEIYSYNHLCWTDTFSIYVHEPDIIENIGRTFVRFYPNPATDQLTIEFDHTVAATSVMLFDLTGKLVHSETIDNPNSQTHTLNLSSLRKGLYFIRISNDEYSITEKVIKAE